MASRFTRNVINVNDISKFKLTHTTQNDLVSDDKEIYIHNHDKFEQITSSVKSVNNKKPDDSGNVTIVADSGYVVFSPQTGYSSVLCFGDTTEKYVLIFPSGDKIEGVYDEETNQTDYSFNTSLIMTGDENHFYFAEKETETTLIQMNIIRSDWDIEDPLSVSYIKNKPEIVSLEEYEEFRESINSTIADFQSRLEALENPEEG